MHTKSNFLNKTTSCNISVVFALCWWRRGGSCDKEENCERRRVLNLSYIVCISKDREATLTLRGGGGGGEHISDSILGGHKTLLTNSLNFLKNIGRGAHAPRPRPPPHSAVPDLFMFTEIVRYHNTIINFRIPSLG